MADVQIEAAGESTITQLIGPETTVWVSKDEGYVFYVDNSGDAVYRKTTDGGASWGSPVAVKAASIASLSVWYDKWTPGDNGTLIHMTYADNTSDDVFYRNLDTATDTLSSEVTISTAITVGGIGRATIAKARGGNLAVFSGSNTGQRGFWKSVDGGANWSSIADGVTSWQDHSAFYPGSDADNNDFWFLSWDVSEDDLLIRKYDDSGDSWSTAASLSSSIADVAEANVSPQMSASIRHSDGHLIVVARDGASGLRCWDFDGSTATEKTAVHSNTEEYAVGLFIDQNTGDLYVAYLGKADGSETPQNTVGVYYKVSTNGGTSWGSETAVAETLDDHRALWVGQGGTSSRFYPIWFNDDLNDIMANFGNSVAIEPPAGGSTRRYSLSLTGVG